MIPKRFIRVWIGPDEIPELFEKWWNEFKQIHEGWDFVTIRSPKDLDISEELKPVILDVIENGNCAALSDVLRLLAVYQIGGVYIDTDNMPLKSFEPLVKENQPFLGKRSQVSFESAVIGSPKGHEAIKAVLDALPKYYWENEGKAASVRTGPAFISKFLFGRKDVTHCPIRFFYPYNGFMAPKRDEKMKLFDSKNNFPSMMFSAHLSNHIWGSKPKNFIKSEDL